MNALIPAGNTSLVPASIDQALDIARVMATSKMVPKHLQGDVGTCFMVVEQAARWNMSPFSVAQCTSNIGGKLMYEGKLVAAAATSCRAIVGEFDYEFSGDPLKPETLAVTVIGARASDGQRKEIHLAWKDAKTTNDFWRKQPEQQLVYAGARVWCRRWTPWVLLGVYAPEEIEPGQRDVFTGPTIEGEAAPPPPQHAESKSPRDTQAAEAWPSRAPAAPPPESTPPRRPRKSLMDEIREELGRATTLAEVLAVSDWPEVHRALKLAPPAAQQEIKDMLADAYERIQRVSDEAGEAAEDEADAIEGDPLAPDDTVPFDEPIAGEKFAGA